MYDNLSLPVIAISLCLAASGVSLISLIYLIGFIAWNEVLSKQVPWKEGLTRVNALILLGTASTLFYAFSVALTLYWEHINIITSSAFATAAQLWFALIEYSYVTYSWLRSAAVIRRKSKRVHKLMERGVQGGPLLFLIQVIPTFFIGRWWSENFYRTAEIAFFTVNAIIGVLLILFDAILMANFISYLRETHIGALEDSRPEFETICRFGLGAVLCATGVLASFLAEAFTGMPVQGICCGLVCVTASILFAVLIAMKVCVFGLTCRQASEGKDSIKIVRRMNILPMARETVVIEPYASVQERTDLDETEAIKT